MSTIRIRLLCVICVMVASAAWAAGAVPEALRYWKPVADHPYLQEIGARIPAEQPVTALAALGETVYAVTGGTAYVVRDGALERAAGAPEGIHRLRALDGALWAASETGAYRFAGDAWQRVDERPFVDFCLHLGAVHGATRDEIFRFQDGSFVSVTPEGGYLSSDSTVVMEDFSQVLADPVRIGPIDRIASYSGTLYILRPGALALIDVDTFVPEPIDWGTLPSRVTRDMLVQGSRLYVTTERGLAVVRGMALTVLTGADGLPYEDTTCLAEGFDSDLWIGTTRGAIRRTGSEFHYFGADHWLPGDYVRDIAVAGHAAYIATDKGLGIIRYEPYTLAKKAAFFERALEEWGHKRLGFVHSLYWSGDQDGWLRGISDDGGHTTHYLAAMVQVRPRATSRPARRPSTPSKP